MRKLRLLSIPSLLVLLGSGCQPTPEPAAESTAPPRTEDQVQADVEALRARWQELANARDVAGVANLYTEDAYYADQYGGIHDGRAAIAAYLEQSLPNSSGYDIQIGGTVMDGDMVASYGTWSAKLALPAGELATGGLWQTLGVYQADGSLQLRLHHSTIPAAAPGPPPIT